MKRNLLILMLCLVMALSFGCSTNAGEGDSNAEIKDTQVSSDVESTSQSDAPESSTSSAQEENETGEVVIDNYNKETIYEMTPERAVVLSYNSAEILSALGVADRIVALREDNNTLDDVLEPYRSALSEVPKPESINTAEGIPTLENLLSVTPDIMITNSYYFNVPTFGTPEDYNENDVNLYITEGSYIPNCTIENTYNDILNLGAIFDVNENAEGIVDELKLRVEAVEDKVSSLKKVKTFVFSNDRDGAPMTAGGTGLVNDIVTKAGGENIFLDIDNQWGAGTWEEVINRNPDVIVIIKNQTDEEAENNIDFIKNMPELADVSAVKNDRFIILPLNSLFPGLQNINAIENLAEFIHADSY